MSDDVTQILTLLYRYGAMMDAGDFDGAARLLGPARIWLGEAGEVAGYDMARIWRDMIIVHPCDTPRTQHVITNPIVDIAPSGSEARCTALYTVFQQVDGFPLQAIAAGRYEDGFTRDGPGWRFASRDYSHFNFKGNLRYHLRDMAR